jgi:hypothetical protein
MQLLHHPFPIHNAQYINMHRIIKHDLTMNEIGTTCTRLSLLKGKVSLRDAWGICPPKLLWNILLLLRETSYDDGSYMQLHAQFINKMIQFKI